MEFFQGMWHGWSTIYHSIANNLYTIGEVTGVIIVAVIFIASLVIGLDYLLERH